MVRAAVPKTTSQRRLLLPPLQTRNLWRRSIKIRCMFYSQPTPADTGNDDDEIKPNKKEVLISVRSRNSCQNDTHTYVKYSSTRDGFPAAQRTNSNAVRQRYSRAPLTALSSPLTTGDNVSLEAQAVRAHLATSTTWIYILSCRLSTSTNSSK